MRRYGANHLLESNGPAMQQDGDHIGSDVRVSQWRKVVDERSDGSTYVAVIIDIEKSHDQKEKKGWETSHPFGSYSSSEDLFLRTLGDIARFLDERKSTVLNIQNLFIVVLAPYRLTSYTNIVTSLEAFKGLLSKLSNDLTTIELAGVVVLVLEVCVLSVANTEGGEHDGVAVTRWQFFQSYGRSTLLASYGTKQIK